MQNDTHFQLDFGPPRVHHLVGLPHFCQGISVGHGFAFGLSKRPTTSCCPRSLNPFSVCALGFCQLAPEDNGKPRRAVSGPKRRRYPQSQQAKELIKSCRRASFPLYFLGQIPVPETTLLLFYGASDSDSNSAAAASAFLSLQLFVGFPLFTL